MVRAGSRCGRYFLGMVFECRGLAVFDLVGVVARHPFWMLAIVALTLSGGIALGAQLRVLGVYWPVAVGLVVATLALLLAFKAYKEDKEGR